MARVLFVQNFWFEYLGTMILSAVLKKAGHTVDLVIDSDAARIARYARTFQPDLVAMYCVSGSHAWVTRTLKNLKESIPVRTIVGGPHATYFPEIIEEEGVDIVCRGEGEGAFSELAERIDHHESFNDIRNLWVKTDTRITRNPIRPLIENLDALPFPDRDLYYKYDILKTSPSKHFITGRGCPFACTFCCNKAYKEIYQGLGTMIRRADPARVCEEIRAVADRYPLESVRFDDEVFLLDHDWAVDFLKRYATEIHLPFSCLIRADLTNPAIVRAMKDAGCYIAYFGIESGNDRIRNQVLGKNISRDQIRQTAWLLRKHGIRIGTFNMVGMPGESFENAWETVRLNQEIRSDYPWCSIIQPYPGTELERQAKNGGFLDPEYGVADLTQSYFNNTVLDNPDAQAIVALQKLFYLAVKFPSLSGIIRKMARSGRYGGLHRWIFNITYAYRYSKTYRMPFTELVRRALLWKANY